MMMHDDCCCGIDIVVVTKTIPLHSMRRMVVIIKCLWTPCASLNIFFVLLDSIQNQTLWDFWFVLQSYILLVFFPGITCITSAVYAHFPSYYVMDLCCRISLWSIHISFVWFLVIEKLLPPIFLNPFKFRKLVVILGDIKAIIKW